MTKPGCWKPRPLEQDADVFVLDPKTKQFMTIRNQILLLMMFGLLWIIFLPFSPGQVIL
jgi:hypothetical protein